MTRVVALGLSPNTEKDDITKAIFMLLSPWAYKKGPAIFRLEEWFKEYFSSEFAVSFDSARAALFAILDNLGIGKGDEVIMQAFTCVVVANSILATGASPVYVDIKSDLTVDIKDIERKITKKTKAIIVQHTFGISGDLDALVQLSQKRNIYLIEDVAHTIGAEYKGKKLGTFGVASIFSLGRDKAFSSVFGGVAITKSEFLGKRLKAYQRARPYPSNFWIMQQLLHPIIFSIVLPLYLLGSVGKVILVFSQKLKLLSFPVSSTEKRGLFSERSIKKYPNALAELALKQLSKVEKYNKKRKEISKLYKKACEELHIELVSRRDISYLRFPILVEHQKVVQNFFKESGIYVGDWYAHIIDPKDSNYTAVKYKKGSCPVAESMSRKIINLPTYPKMRENDVERVMYKLKEYVTS